MGTIGSGVGVCGRRQCPFTLVQSGFIPAAPVHSGVEEAVHVECPATPALFCAVLFQC